MGIQIMFDQANSFYICSQLCKRELDKQPGRHDIYATPQIVNLAFACEVYLKTLLTFSEIDIKKKHKLNDLFDALPDEDKRHIETYMQTCYPFQSVVGWRKIDIEANAFVNWRYSYERVTLSCDISYLEALAQILQMLCCEKLYNVSWEQYCITAKINSDLWG